MNRPRTLLLDNEALQALADPNHPKHRRALAIVHEFALRRLRATASAGPFVPAAVRVEAGWDRRSAATVILNRLRILDLPLDRDSADHAAAIRTSLNVSVADAHLGASVIATPGPHAVATSDVGDMRKIAEHLGAAVNIARL